jgi:DNA-binding NarL/FixJ family response regulator
VLPSILRTLSKSSFMKTLNDYPRTERAIVDDLVSPAEKVVWAKIAEGLSTKEVAAQLNKSHKTVECQRCNLMRKLNARGTADLTRKAIQFGIISVEVYR